MPEGSLSGLDPEIYFVVPCLRYSIDYTYRVLFYAIWLTYGCAPVCGSSVPLENYLVKIILCFDCENSLGLLGDTIRQISSSSRSTKALALISSALDNDQIGADRHSYAELVPFVNATRKIALTVSTNPSREQTQAINAIPRLQTIYSRLIRKANKLSVSSAKLEKAIVHARNICTQKSRILLPEYSNCSPERSFCMSLCGSFLKNRTLSLGEVQNYIKHRTGFGVMDQIPTFSSWTHFQQPKVQDFFKRCRKRI